MNNINVFAAMCVQLGPLAFLSIQHTQPGMTPEAPSNEERARAFRNAQPLVSVNSYAWRFRQMQGQPG